MEHSLVKHEGLSADKISEYLNSRYKRVPIQKHDLSLFTASFVRKILDNDTYAGYITYGKTKGKVDKKDRSKTQRIKSEDYIKVTGTHEPLISQDMWVVASTRREESKRNNVRNKHRESDHIYPLTGLIICPECGTALNGFSSIKQNKNKGGMYKTTYAYKCRNNKTQRGHICGFNRQLNEEAMCNEVILMLNKLATIDAFTTMVAEKIGAGVDVSNLEDELKLYEKNRAKAKRNAERLGIDIDNLDYDDEAYEAKRENLIERWETAVKQESEYNKKADEIRRRIKAAKEKQLTRESIITILSNFKVWYNEMNDEERKKLLHELIERIEIRKNLGEGKSGRLDYSNIIERIVLAIPISINGEISEIYLTKENTVETVVLLSKGEIDSKKIRVEFSLEDMDTSGFQQGATYEQIKGRVLEQTGLKVSSLYISQIKRKCGLEVGQSYNLSKKENAKQPQCPPEKEKAIREAMKYFGMI